MERSTAIERPESAESLAQVPYQTSTYRRETVLLIGSRGVIGSELRALLEARPGLTVLEAGRSAASTTKLQLDISDIESIKALDEKIPAGVEHIVVCCGSPVSGAVSSLDSEAWTRSLTDKFVAVTRLAIMLANGAEVRALRPRGSITVTSGPSSLGANNAWGPAMAAANAGIEAFVRSAGVDLPRGIRCNGVSPSSMVRETAIKAGLPLTNTVTAAECAAAFVPLIFSDKTGEIVVAGACWGAPSQPATAGAELCGPERPEAARTCVHGLPAGPTLLPRKRAFDQDAVDPLWGFV
jgi:enoyl-[acyl-carrier-protein] reductase (NADH)